MSDGTPRIEIGKPGGFWFYYIVAGNLLGAVPGALAGIAIVVFPISLLSAMFGRPVFLVPASVAMLILLLCMTFLPMILANPFVTYLVGRFPTEAPDGCRSYICQMSLRPRLQTGIRGLMEDADDIGYLWVSSEGVNFQGDYIRVFLPFSAIDTVRDTNIGWRSAWIGARRIDIDTRALNGYEGLQFIDRQANTLISARRNSRNMLHDLAASPRQEQSVSSLR